MRKKLERTVGILNWPLLTFLVPTVACSAPSDSQPREDDSPDLTFDAMVDGPTAPTPPGPHPEPPSDAMVDGPAILVPPGPRALDVNPNCKVPVRTANAISVEDFGAKPGDNVDDSEALNKAIAAAGEGGTIYIPSGLFDVRTDYVPFSGNYAFELQNRQTLLMESETTLRAAANGLEGSAIIHIHESTDVTIVGGRLMGDRKAHKGTTGEWGMGIRSKGARNLRIARTHLSEFWGDGIVLSRSTEGGLTEGVTICGVVSDNNRRQGLSITGANNVLIEDSSFTNTSGTLPEGGIDLEPDDADGSTKITIRHCTFSGNRVGFYSTALPKTGRAGKDVVLEQSIIEHSGESGVVVYGGENIVIRGNLIRKNQGNGLLVKTTLPVLIERNIIADNTGEGIHLEPAEDFDNGETHRHQVRSNSVRRSGKIGMRVIWSHDNLITGNVIEDTDTFGVELHVSHRNVVSDNTIKSSSKTTGEYAGLLIDIGDENQIKKNIIERGSGLTSYGIWIKKFNNNRNTLQENRAVGPWLKQALYDQGTGTVLIGNQGFDP